MMVINVFDLMHFKATILCKLGNVAEDLSVKPTSPDVD